MYYVTSLCGRYSVFKKKFNPEKVKKRASKVIIGPTPFFHSPAQTTAQSPELIFHIMKSRDQTSVLLSVARFILKLVQLHSWAMQAMHGSPGVPGSIIWII